ncbi:MAG TPA: hypothetical protein VMH39_07120 [Gemmatimonadaceae bacterium]|nr:hypothetical protein [Gemmatimonadaceae bacterium]
MKAAFLGLFIGAIAILCILTTIVHLTNARYDREASSTQPHG